MDKKEMMITLAKKGVIVIDGDTEPKMAYAVQDALNIARASGHEELHIQITSNGGRVDIGLDIYDLIRLYPARQRIGTVLGFARSMGAVILQACDHRKCARHAKVLIHYVSTSSVALDAMKDKKRLNLAIARGEQDQQALDRILAHKTGKTIQEIRRVCAKDTDMNAEEALKFGLIDEII